MALAIDNRAAGAPGAVIGGRYRLEGALGRGATATVYRATHVRTGRPVAVKLMDDALLADPVAVRRFEREARVTTRVPHPNIVEVLDAGLDESRRPYIVTALLEGETLAARLERTPGPLPLREVASLVLPLLDGLAAAHDAGVVHRDFKPGNVFLHVGRDGARVPTLVDFGISKNLRNAGATMLTIPGTIFGTPHYISPEQALSSTDVDARTDVWAAGVLLYRLLVGRVPFDAAHPGALLSRIFDAIPASPAAYGVPPAVSSVVLRCLAKDRNARYADARALKLALCEALGLPPDVTARRSLPSLRIAAAPVAAPTVRPPPPAPPAPPPAVALAAPSPPAAALAAPSPAAVAVVAPRVRAALAAAVALLAALWVLAGAALVRALG